MNKHTAEQTARLEAVAVMRLIGQNAHAEVALMIRQSEDPAELARAACGVAMGLLVNLRPGMVEATLDALTEVVLAEG